MTNEEFEKACMRTFNKGLTEKEALCMSALGLTGEAGEVADVIKKAMFHGHELNKQDLLKELSDCAWYLAVLSQLLGSSLGEVFDINYQKLLARYPNGFSEADSINRKD